MADEPDGVGVAELVTSLSYAADLGLGLTERMLAGIDGLALSRGIAGRHHERLDGSGYPAS